MSKDREKEKVDDRPAKLKEEGATERARAELLREIKNKWDTFLSEEQHQSFVAAVNEMWELLAATIWKWVAVKKKKGNKITFYISSIKRVTRKLLEVSLCSRAKQRQRNVQKSVLHVQSCFFAN